MIGRDMFVLIDAFNLIYKFPDLELCMYEDRLDEAKLGLLEILRDVRSILKEVEFLVFIDGTKIRGDRETYQEDWEGIRIFYSHEREADDLIRGYIKENPNPNHLTLITSDKKIIQFAKQFKVKCITSEAYSTTVKNLLMDSLSGEANTDKIQKQDVDVSDSDIAEWMKAFNSNQSQTK